MGDRPISKNLHASLLNVPSLQYLKSLSINVIITLLTLRGISTVLCEHIFYLVICKLKNVCYFNALVRYEFGPEIDPHQLWQPDLDFHFKHWRERCTVQRALPANGLLVKRLLATLVTGGSPGLVPNLRLTVALHDHPENSQWLVALRFGIPYSWRFEIRYYPHV